MLYVEDRQLVGYFVLVGIDANNLLTRSDKLTHPQQYTVVHRIVLTCG